MSDCSNRFGYDAIMLRIDFKGEDTPWMYPLALNGREMERVTIDGVRFEPVRECEREYYKPTNMLVCSKCGCGMDKQLDKYCFLNYCPNCGAKVVG